MIGRWLEISIKFELVFINCIDKIYTVDLQDNIKIIDVDEGTLKMLKKSAMEYVETL